MDKKSRIKQAVRIAVYCLVIFIALKIVRRLVLPLPMDRCKVKKFDRMAWQDSALVYSKTAIRGCMVDDLLRKQSLVGLKRSQVEALLGKPPATGYFKQYDLVYWLGPERSLMSIDSEWLVIKLDANGRVAEVHLVTD